MFEIWDVCLLDVDTLVNCVNSSLDPITCVIMLCTYFRLLEFPYLGVARILCLHFCFLEHVKCMCVRVLLTAGCYFVLCVFLFLLTFVFAWNFDSWSCGALMLRLDFEICWLFAANLLPSYDIRNFELVEFQNFRFLGIGELGSGSWDSSISAC